MVKRVLHLISGGDVGGAKTHVLTLINELQKTIPVKLICFMEGSFADEARQMGIDILVLEQERRYDLKVVDKLISIIKQEDFDIIHSHGARANFITRFIKNKINIPCVTTVHSDFMLDFKGNLYKHIIYTNLNVFALKKFDYFIAISGDFEKMLIGRGFPKDKIYTVYNGIDFDEKLGYKNREEFLEEKGLSHLKGKTIVGILARLHPVKGHDIFIKAAACVVENNKDIHFLVAGDGEEMNTLKNLSKELGVENNVHFIGFTDKPYDFLNAIDINVLTSYSESFPYVLLEGARLKKPTIASAVGGIPMLIKDGINGYLFKAGDSNELAEKMGKMIQSEDKRSAMGESLFKIAKDNYSLKKLSSDHIKIYDNMLQNTKEGKSIVISGYYGFGNSGDEAILKSIVRDFRDYDPNVKITALSNNAAKTSREYGINSISRLNLIKISKAIKACDLFISGGGSLLQDQTSTRSLLYYLFMIRIAQHYNKKVMLYANGIGPINSKTNIKRVKKVINEVDLITLREEESFKLLKSLGVEKPKIVLTADPVLTTQPSEDKVIEDIFIKEEIPLEANLIGVNIRKWKMLGDLKNQLAQSLEYIYNRYKLMALFIPMSHEDMDIILETVKLVHTPYRVLSNIYEPEELIGMMGRMKIIIAMRLHTLIYSSIAGTPMIGLVYDPKIKGYLDYIEQHAAGNVENIESSMVNDKVDMIMENYITEKNSLGSKMLKMKEMAKENVKLAYEIMKG